MLLYISADTDALQTPHSRVTGIYASSSASEKCLTAMISLYIHKQPINQKKLLDTKDTILTNKSGVIQWYFTLCTHGETCGVFISPTTTLLPE